MEFTPYVEAVIITLPRIAYNVGVRFVEVIIFKVYYGGSSK